MRGTDARQQPRNDRMIEKSVDHLWTKLYGEQQEIGNIFDVPFGQCGKQGRWFQLLWPNCGGEWTVHFASFHLIQNKFAHGAIIVDA